MPPVTPGSLVLVTGANGYIAGITIQKLLDLGYKVRGTVRNISKHSWMLSHYGPNFSLVEIPEMSIPGAFDEAVKGVDGIAHIASSVHFDLDVDAVVKAMVATALGLLEAAGKEERVKNVVYTSSSWACKHVGFHEPYVLTPKTWNEGSKKAMSGEYPDGASVFERMALNYACGKMEAEQQCFKWVEDNKPGFTFNSVLPGNNMGRMTRPDVTGFISSSGHLKKLWEGDPTMAGMIPPQWFVDVEDSALLHIAALTLPGVENERLLGLAKRFTWNQIVDVFKSTCPDRKFMDRLEESQDQGTVENGRSEELLRQVKGKGFTSVEESVRNWIPWMLDAEKRGSTLPEGEIDRLIKV